MSLIGYHIFSRPLPYAQTLALQQCIHEIQLQRRRAAPGSHDDVLLLLEHRPVYTAGRRQTDEEVIDESTRLRHLGADFVPTKRGGQTTYHGPGQVVGYPLLDLARMRLSIADYISKLQIILKQHFLKNYAIQTIESENTGVFLAPHLKLASIGVQVRHRLTTHGFAYNLTPEPLSWFNQVMACGLADVKAECIVNAVGHQVSPRADLDSLLVTASRVFGRDLVKVDTTREGQLEGAIRELEAVAEQMGPWLPSPALR